MSICLAPLLVFFCFAAVHVVVASVKHAKPARLVGLPLQNRLSCCRHRLSPSLYMTESFVSHTTSSFRTPPLSYISKSSITPSASASIVTATVLACQQRSTYSGKESHCRGGKRYMQRGCTIQQEPSHMTLSMAASDSAGEVQQYNHSTEASSLSNSPAASSSATTSVLWTSFSLLLWYLISSYYNIYNKRALNMLELPWTIATIQMGAGMMMFIPMWIMGIRSVPFRSVSEFQLLGKNLILVALFTTLSHIAGVVSLGLGSVSFVQVVKAAEPLFTALISALWVKEFLPLLSYMCMIPVIVGVVIASVSELQFSWACLVAGSLSNLFAGARGVIGKHQMQHNSQKLNVLKQLSPANFYSLISIFSFLLCVPFMALKEGPAVYRLITDLANCQLSTKNRNGLLNAFLSGAMHYLYNEMSFQVLAKMNPVSHALANTVKRVAVIALSVVVFNTNISSAGKLGSVIAIAGALAYSLVGRR